MSHSRVIHSMARLAPSLQEIGDSVIINLVSLEKQARAGKVRVFFQIPKFPEDNWHHYDLYIKLYAAIRVFWVSNPLLT